jgi:preprotein translocase subunit SecG
MEDRHSMALLRLAYATEFMIAVIAVFTLWSQVGGQGHLDIMPWYLKLVLGCGAAFAAVKATAAAVAAKNGWNGRMLRWLGILVTLLFLCGVATYYVHVYGEDDEPDDEQDNPAALSAVRPASKAELLAASGADDRFLSSARRAATNTSHAPR